MSMWYQWFRPAPTITMDLPWVSCAFCANSRATWITWARGTEVCFSCQAGV